VIGREHRSSARSGGPRVARGIRRLAGRHLFPSFTLGTPVGAVTSPAVDRTADTPFREIEFCAEGEDLAHPRRICARSAGGRSNRKEAYLGALAYSLSEAPLMERIVA
jgi:hypothetical protein